MQKIQELQGASRLQRPPAGFGNDLRSLPMAPLAPIIFDQPIFFPYCKPCKSVIGIVWLCFKQCHFGHPRAPHTGHEKSTRIAHFGRKFGQNDVLFFFGSQTSGSEDSRRTDVLPHSHLALKSDITKIK